MKRKAIYTATSHFEVWEKKAKLPTYKSKIIFHTILSGLRYRQRAHSTFIVQQHNNIHVTQGVSYDTCIRFPKISWGLEKLKINQYLQTKKRSYGRKILLNSNRWKELTRQLLLAENSLECWSCDNCFLVPGHAQCRSHARLHLQFTTFERFIWPENAEKNALVL